VSATLGARVAAFTAHLRERERFGVGQAQTLDALRAAERVGITDLRRVRAALRLVYCASPDEVARFDAAFDAFFRGPRGIAQPHLGSRNTRPASTPPKDGGERAPRPGGDRPAARALPVPADPASSSGWEALLARYSASAARSAPPAVAAQGLETMRAAAARLVSRLRLAQARRWRAERTGPRVDLRRTLRAIPQTGGDPIALARRGHARESARFIVLIDASRSMAEHVAPLLQFAHALCRTTRRAHAFVFSTALHDLTRTLRDPLVPGRPLRELGEAWGGGTRLGASLEAFVERAGRLITPQTIVLIGSDGLDTGELERLERAMRALHGRTAVVVWLHPSAGSTGFTPSAQGMRTALPYVDALLPAAGADDLAALPERLASYVRAPSFARRARGGGRTYALTTTR
jgi:uncharacterized protein with von Willebrand factor type A (vWA) domain